MRKFLCRLKVIKAVGESAVPYMRGVAAIVSIYLALHQARIL